jgi:hypothetical protein
VVLEDEEATKYEAKFGSLLRQDSFLGFDLVQDVTELWAYNLQRRELRHPNTLQLPFQ